MTMNISQVRVVDPVLTTVVQGYKNPEFVGDALFPAVPVGVSGGKIIEFGKESFLAYNSQRAPGGATRRISFGYQGKPFSLENHALEAPVPREYQRDAAKVPGINLGTRAVNLTMRANKQTLEIQQAALATDAANYPTANKITLSGTDKWSNAASKPVSIINAGKEAVRQAIGVYPNVLLLGAQAFNPLKDNPSILERFKYTSKESITAEMLAALFDLDKVVVGKAVQATDAGVMSDVWGNFAVLAYVPSSPSQMEEPSYGYTYTMEGHPLVETPYYDNNAKSWIYGVTYERAPVLSGIAAGYLISAPN